MARTPPHGSPLVDTPWLAAHLGDADLRVIDLRWAPLGQIGRERVRQRAHRGRRVRRPRTCAHGPRGARAPPHSEPRAGGAGDARGGRLGSTRVVVYDDAGGSVAARLWWPLTAYGHARVHVLDGGLPAWVASGGALVTDSPTVTPGTFVVAGNVRLPVLDRHAVDAIRGRAGWVLLDARAPERYRGEVEPIDARPGHIPGARNAPWATAATSSTAASPTRRRSARTTASWACARAPRWSPTAVLGVTACHDVLALAIARISATRVLLYEGSWSDWARDPDRPAALGDA